MASKWYSGALHIGASRMSRAFDHCARTLSASSRAMHALQQCLEVVMRAASGAGFSSINRREGSSAWGDMRPHPDSAPQAAASVPPISYSEWNSNKPQAPRLMFESLWILTFQLTLRRLRYCQSLAFPKEPSAVTFDQIEPSGLSISCHPESKRLWGNAFQRVDSAPETKLPLLPPFHEAVWLRRPGPLMGTGGRARRNRA